MVASDARSRTKIYLEAKITDVNLTKDDDTTELSYIVAFGKPSYPLTRVFTDKDVDLIFSVEEPVSTPLIQYDMTIWGYKEKIPITVYCIDKSDVTGELIKWKAKRELRLVFESYPFGSVRHTIDEVDNDQVIGGTTVYSCTFTLNYRRNKTV